MSKKAHNYDLCQRKDMRCVHCCSLDYDLPKDYYASLFQKRRQIFDETVKDFPRDLSKYLKTAEEQLKEPAESAVPCIYIGMVDSNPGCMVHPSRHDGPDVRSTKELLGHACLPTHGCYFQNYLRTRPEKKIFREFMQEADDWYSYSRNLRDCAVFNKQNGYIIARLPTKALSRKSVIEVSERINERLNQKFPRQLDMFEDAMDEFFPTPTESYMASSPLFAAWGFGAVHSSKDIKKEPHFEKRFKKQDFAEWGYHLDPEGVMYIHVHSGEILPIQFRDVLITNDAALKESIAIVNRTIGSFKRRFR
jgi:hypothetical protein